MLGAQTVPPSRSGGEAECLAQCVELGEQQIVLISRDGVAARQVLDAALARLEHGRPVVRLGGAAPPDELHRRLSEGLGVPAPGEADPQGLAQAMRARHVAGAPAVLLVCDEADRLPPDSMAYLGSLQALSTEHFSAVQTVLTGSPELRTLLGDSAELQTAFLSIAGPGPASAPASPVASPVAGPEVRGALVPVAGRQIMPLRGIDLASAVTAGRWRWPVRGTRRVLLPASGWVCALVVATLAMLDHSRQHPAVTAPPVRTAALAPARATLLADAAPPPMTARAVRPLPRTALPVQPMPLTRVAPPIRVAQAPTPAPAAVRVPGVPGAWAHLAGLADLTGLRQDGLGFSLAANSAAHQGAAAVLAARDAVVDSLPALPEPSRETPGPATISPAAAASPPAPPRPPSPPRLAVAASAAAAPLPAGRPAAPQSPTVLVLSDATLPKVILRGGRMEARAVLQRAGFSVAPGQPSYGRRAAIGFFFLPDRTGAADIGRVLAPDYGPLPLLALRAPANPPPPGTIEVDLPP
jgi:hypothetical protein